MSEKELIVYSCHDGFAFHRENSSFASLRLSPEWEGSIYYVKDKVQNTICFVGMGNHISAIVFLLKKHYGLIDYKEEDVSKWQNIIRDNFVLYNHYNYPTMYAEQVIDEVPWWGDEVEEVRE